MTSPPTKIEVVWDGVQVYRVPYAAEIDAIRFLAEGHSTRQASQLLGMSYADGARDRSASAQLKLRALSSGDALYHMYRLGILPNPRDPQLEPVLDPAHIDIIQVTIRLGIPYEQAHKSLGMGKNRLVQQMNEICHRLQAATRPQVMQRAVAHGDLVVNTPAQLWRGEI